MLSPAGKLDLSQIKENDNTPVSIRRSVQYFLAFTEKGQMFVSPSGN